MSVFFKRRGQYDSLIKQLSNYAIGDSVFFKVNNQLEEFLVIRHINPSSKYYDETFNGTWIIKKNPIIDVSFYDINNVTTNFLNSLETNLRNEIKQVKLPVDNKFEITKCFIPSAAELDATYNLDGSKLYYEVPRTNQWTRTSNTALINNNLILMDNLNQKLDIYPIFLLPYDTLMFKTLNTFAGGKL